MAVALRGYTQGTTQASGSTTIAWPAGTVAGDLALVVAKHNNHRNGPSLAGWTAYPYKLWAKRVTAADIASPLAVDAKICFLQTFSGAARIGEVRFAEGVKITQAGGALFVSGAGPTRVGTIDPGATNRIGNQVATITDNHPHAVWYRLAASAGYLALTDHDHDCRYCAYEIIPLATPGAPTLVTPTANQQLDASQSIVFSWLHQSATNAEQDGVQIRIRVNGSGTWSYVQAAGTITTTPTTLTQSAQTAAINTGVLTSGTLYEYQIATREFTGSLGTYSTLSFFTPVAKPVVNTITPTSTAESLTPTVAWTATMGVGSQESFQVRISPSTDANSETPLWDSGIVPSSATSTVAPATTAWTNGQTLYAWVRVLQTGGLWSPWTQDNATFAVTWTPPVAPSSVVAANVADQPLQVTVAGITADYDLTVQMSIDGGDNWTPVHALQNPGTPTTVQIPLAGYGVSTLFRARTSITLSDVVVLYSDWVNSTALASTDKNVYLVSEDGNTFLQVRMVSDDAHTVAQGVSITYGHGATRPRQDQTEAMGEMGSTTLQAANIEQEQEIVAWLTTQGTWWLRWGPERGPSLSDKPATLMALAGPVTVNRIAQFNTAYRDVRFPWVEQ